MAAPNHSHQQIAHQVMANFDAILALEKLRDRPGTAAAERAGYQNDINRINRAQSYWNREYRKITGKNITQTVEPITIRAKDPQKVAAETKWKNDLSFRISRAQGSLVSLVQNCQSARKHASDHWVRAFLVHQSGGVSFMAPFLIERKVQPNANSALANAKRALQQGNYAQAEVYFLDAARWINRGGRALHQYQEALGIGANRVEVAIKVSASVAVGAVGTLSSLSAAGTVAVETAGAAAGEATTLAAEGLDSKRAVSDKAIQDAVVNTLVAGGTAAAGEFGKAILGPTATDLLFGSNATTAQRKAVEDAIAKYYSANAKQIVDAVKKLREGKEPSYDWWAGLLTPALNAAGPVGSGAGTVWSEKKVRDELMGSAKAKQGLAP